VSTAIDQKNARIEFKTSREIKELLQRAANTLGVDLSSFLIATATQRAKEVILEEKMLTLSHEEWAAFEKELNNPAPAGDELKKLINPKD